MSGDSVWKHLEVKSASVLSRWNRLIIETYLEDTSRFLKDEKDRFVNPVGHAISEGTKVIFDELLHGMDPEKLACSLDELIRIRTVQEFSPSQAVGFVFLLKQAVREELASKTTSNGYYAELLDFEARIDKLILLAFDVHMKCREKVCEIRMNEVASQRDMALRILATTSEMDGAEEAG